MKINDRKNLFLINLGGPRTSAEIEPFLRDLFLDPFVFDLPLPEFVRKKLALWITKRRTPKVRKTYESMGFGGGSPLYAETVRQAEALKKILKEKYAEDWNVSTYMSCGYPNIRDLKNFPPSSHNVYLPLYPQFSRSTVLSTYNIIKQMFGDCPVASGGVISHFGMDERFLEITANFIYKYLTNQLDLTNFLHAQSYSKTLNWKNVDLVFSAHGIPMRLIKKGDCYTKELEYSVRKIEEKLRAKGFVGGIHLSYQSKVGPARWTEPNTLVILERLAKQNKDIVIYPISFVSDHLETLEEIGIEFKELSAHFGANSFHRVPALGTHLPFLTYLAEVVSAKKNKADECVCKKYGGEMLGKCPI
ncbi:ferrochelatase [Leptospira sp. 96542]|nr:ferrochelatase [Leptospira sp. 96542]